MYLSHARPYADKSSARVSDDLADVRKVHVDQARSHDQLRRTCHLRNATTMLARHAADQEPIEPTESTDKNVLVVNGQASTVP